ncbi:ABC transporter permease [Hoeflea sp. CAU 1731]
MRSFRNPAIESLLALILLFVLWEMGVHISGVPSFILPAPSEVFEAMLPHMSVLWRHSMVTLGGTLLSLVLGAGLGMLAGLAIGYSPGVSRLLYPILGGLHALPMSAFIPIFVVWFGTGMFPKVLAGLLIAFFPVTVNVVTGLRTIESELWEMLRTIGATRAQIFRKIGVPNTLPYFSASLKVAVAGAFIGNVVGEMIAAGSGLGYVLILSTNGMNMPLAFAALSILLLFGVALFTVFDTLERFIAPWAFRKLTD